MGIIVVKLLLSHGRLLLSVSHLVPTFYFLRRMHLFGEEDKTGTAAPALLANLEELFGILLTQ